MKGLVSNFAIKMKELTSNLLTIHYKHLNMDYHSSVPPSLPYMSLVSAFTFGRASITAFNLSSPLLIQIYSTLDIMSYNRSRLEY